MLTMKRSLYILLALAMILSAAGCTRFSTPQAPTPQAGDLAAPPADELQAIAVTVIEDLAKGDYSAAFEQFDSNMKSALPEAKLQETWEGITAQVGAFQEQVGARTTEVQGRPVVTVTCRFEQDLLDLQLGFNEQSQVTGLFFSKAQAAAPTPAVYRPPEYVKEGAFREVEVTIGSGEWALPGTLTLPYCAGGPLPAFVLLHGSGPNDRNETIGPNQPFRDLAWGLASHCTAVLRYDKRTFTHAGKFTPGVLAGLTAEQEVIEDALLAIQLLRRTPEVDPRQIYLLGHSEGGMLAPRIAQRNPGLAGLVILAAPSRPLEELFLDQYTYLFNLDGVLSDEEKAGLEAVALDIARIQSPDLSASMDPQEYPLGISPAYWLDLRGYRPAEVATILSMRVFVLQGERDYQILAAKDFTGWKAALEGKDRAALKLYPDLNHLFMPGDGFSTPQEYELEGHVSPEVVADIAAWLGRSKLTSTVPAQDGLSLKVRRWFGLGIGSRVRSRLELTVAGPADLQSVTYLIDGQTLETVQAPAFKHFFHTDSYAPGWHELSAVGQTGDGAVLISKPARYLFLSPEEGNRILYPLLGGVLLLAIGVWGVQMGIFFRKKREFVPLGSRRTYGFAGGTICPKCGRPFALHPLLLGLPSAVLAACPHCGRRGVFKKAPLGDLRRAEAMEVEADTPEERIQPMDAEEKVRQQIDDSRYDDTL